MKEHINFICKTAFFELRRIRTIRHYFSVDATKTLVVSRVLSGIDYCNSLSAGLSLSLISKLQRIQNCAARLVVRASSSVHVTPILKQPVKTRFLTKLPTTVSTPSTTLLPLIFLISCICTLPRDLFVPVLTSAS